MQKYADTNLRKNKENIWNTNLAQFKSYPYINCAAQNLRFVLCIHSLVHTVTFIVSNLFALLPSYLRSMVHIFYFHT